MNTWIYPINPSSQLLTPVSVNLNHFCSVEVSVIVISSTMPFPCSTS